jgi:hypothetical protein
MSLRASPRGCFTVLAAIAVICCPAGPVGAEPRERVVNVALEDQFRTRRETGAMLGDVVVLVFAERKGAEAAHELGKKLHLHFHPSAVTASDSEWLRQPVTGLPGWPAGARVPNVQAIPVACLSEVPKAMHPVVRARIRKESPMLPVWLDFDDTMDRQFGVVPDVANVVILDTRGQVHSTLSGRFDDRTVAELAATIDQVRMQARPAFHTAVVPAAAVR